jgi:hypothetical protein
VESTRDVEATRSAEVDVEQRDVRSQFLHSLECLGTVGGNPDDSDAPER